MVKQIQINLSNKLFYTLITAFTIIVLGIGAYAYVDPATGVGHTSGQIENVDWSKITNIPTDIADGDDIGTPSAAILDTATLNPAGIGNLLGYSKLVIGGKNYAVPLYQIQELKTYSGVVRHGTTTLSAPCGYSKWQVLSVTRSPKPNLGAGSIYNANSGEKEIFYDSCDDDSYLYLNYNKDTCQITHRARTDNDCGYKSLLFNDDWDYEIKFFD